MSTVFKRNRNAQKGFTIVELMFATVVFSLVLMMSMAAIMQITRLYYRGVTQTSTQEAARAIADEFSQAIQFSNDKIFYPTGDEANPTGPDIEANETEDGSLGFVCVGGKRYTYHIDRQLVRDTPDPQKKQVPIGLWVDRPVSEDGTPLGCASSVVAMPLDLTDPVAVDASNGTELLDENMRLTRLDIYPAVAGSDTMWSIDIAVVYGDEDLLELSPEGNRKTCKPSGPGIEFCATSEISTTVRRRVE
jgi:prepilin-type N-terminal cleavage/methylation domain-containing protein